MGSAGPVAGVDREFREGDSLRGRFELISMLGEGGMGAVWKGLDLLKKEAQDRNPYVAIKLLQGDFKEHPEAFIALQRETAKQQRLAHPNIATVYDFDRDENTGTVFMTMEVMEGKPMDEFVKRDIPKEGLSEEQAMPLITDLCAGLAYAHDAKLVHSDLKPGNAFMVKDKDRELGRVKLLDFGIARASKTEADEEGEVTKFDPGKLGALTPTYATIEMFDGQDPDPRDDIYALAIMTYQLYTGKHPYGKKSAPKAKELGLVPEPIAKLNKRQNRGLGRGLAFLRENRTPSVEQFLDDITLKKSKAPMIVAAAAVLLLVIGALAYNPILNTLNERKREEVIAALVQPGIENIRKGLELAETLGTEQEQLVLNDERTRAAIVAHIARKDETSINQALAAIEPYDDRWEQEIRDAEPARKAIVDLYEGRILEAFDIDSDKFDFVAASGILDQLDVLYKDRAFVLVLRNELKSEKDRKLIELSDQYKSFLEQGRLIPNAEEDDIGDVLDIVRAIDPEHKLLADKRLGFAFIDKVETAMAEKDFAVADAFVKAGLAFAPDMGKLNDLSFQVRSELTRIKNEKLVAEIQQRLQDQQRAGNLKTLAHFQAVRDDLIVLADLDPTNKVLVQIQGNLKAAFSEQLRADIQGQKWEPGETLLVDFAKLLEIPYLTKQRSALSEAEKQAGFELEMTAARKQAVDERTKTVEALLADPKFNSEWEIALKVPYKELIALLPLGDPLLEPVRNNTARLYLGRAKQARETGNLSQALALIDRGRVFYPGLKNFDTEQQLVAQAQEAERQRLEEEARIARIDALKDEFISKAEANDPENAKKILPQLAEEKVAADDPFISEQAPALLAQAYLRLARSQAEQDQFLVALKFADAGLAYAPDMAELKDARDTYNTEVEKRKLELELAALFDSLDPIDVAKTTKRLNRFKSESPSRYAARSKQFPATRGTRISNHAKSKDLAGLAPRMKEYQAIFKREYPALLKSVTKIVEGRIGQLPTKTAAQLGKLAKPLRDYAAISASQARQFSSTLGDQLAKQVTTLLKTDKALAHQYWLAAVKLLKDNSSLAALDIEPPAPPEVATGIAQMSKGKLSGAEKTLAIAAKKSPGHSEVAAFRVALERAMATALSKYDEYKQAAANTKYKDQKKIDKVYTAVRPLWSDNSAFKKIKLSKPVKGACSDGLAGKGAKRGGICYDWIALKGGKKKKGPVLVVVPSGGSVNTPFAISKYEISVGDFNLYCADSGRCKSKSKPKLPVTGISAQDAAAYAAWLSEKVSKFLKTKVVYRLPTEADWNHAANAKGKQPEQKFNCRVTSSGSCIAGCALNNFKTGKPNGWGLVNYVGNAQELVKTASGFAARGGAFEDPLTKCSVDMVKPHSGSADPITGILLVRELG